MCRHRSTTLAVTAGIFAGLFAVLAFIIVMDDEPMDGSDIALMLSTLVACSGGVLPMWAEHRRKCRRDNASDAV